MAEDKIQKVILKATKEITVRFSEVDSMRIVWHGSYTNYFEDAREEFGRKYGLGYLDVCREGYYVPLVDLSFSYKKPLVYGNAAIVEITYVDTDAAKIIYHYKILSSFDKSIIATGKSVQVFLDSEYRLVWAAPDFYVNWKRLHGLL